ncbi:MAG TPA: OmpA family protein [Vicinamibacterales bacterium]|nr:OmpA family protein [Vicinamibacterales bacterium]
MALVRHVLVLLLATASLAGEQARPVPSAIPGTQLLNTTTVTGPLEVRPATADHEAVLAGLSYTKQRYSARPEILLPVFVATYRDALFAGGWKLIETPKIDKMPPPEGTVSLAAQYMENTRNIYTRISRTPDGAYEINVADVGEEDWTAVLAKECRLPISSLLFDKDRPTIRLFESAPTLKKLSDTLKRKSAPVVEIQGHMDNVGEADAPARQVLSEARAKAVADWLIADGVPKTKISSKGYGKLRPVADNDSDLGRALNRRIEIARPGCTR